MDAEQVAPAIREESTQRPATFRFIGDVGPLFEALAKAQAEFLEISRNAENPHFKSNYANLAEILDAIRPALNKNGLVLLQPSDGFEVVTMLCLGSARFEVSFPLPAWDGPHELGSLLTYVRRYGLKSFFAVNDGEDDDGNAAQKPQGSRQRATPPATQAAPKATAPVNPDALTDATKKRVWELSTKAGFKGKEELDAFSMKSGCGALANLGEVQGLRLEVALKKLEVQP